MRRYCCGGGSGDVEVTGADLSRSGRGLGDVTGTGKDSDLSRRYCNSCCDGAGLVRVMGMGKDYKRKTNFKILRRETQIKTLFKN